MSLPRVSYIMLFGEYCVKKPLKNFVFFIMLFIPLLMFDRRSEKERLVMHIFVSYGMEGWVHFSFAPHMPRRRRNICSARAITAVGWLRRKGEHCKERTSGRRIQRRRVLLERFIFQAGFSAARYWPCKRALTQHDSRRGVFSVLNFTRPILKK